MKRSTGFLIRYIARNYAIALATANKILNIWGFMKFKNAVIKKKIFFISLSLISMHTNCMDSKNIKGSKEEFAFMRNLEQWTSDDKKFFILRSIMRESLKPQNWFIKKLMEIAGKKSNISTLSGHRGAVASVAFSPDPGGNYALSGADDETIKLWDLTNKQNPNTHAIATLSGHDNTVFSVVFSPDGNYALSGSDDGKIKLWDLSNKQNPNTHAIATLSGHASWAYSVAFSPDGNYALSGACDGTIKLWDLSNKQNPNTQPIATLTGHGDLVRSVAFSPDGNYALSGSDDKTIKLWDLRNKQNPNTHAIATLSGHGDLVYSVAFSPDGNYALSGSYNKTIKLWDLKSLIKLHKYFDKVTESVIGESSGKNKIIQYMLLKSILKFRNKQIEQKDKKPFSISYPKLKNIFNGLPDILKDALLDEKYVVLKEN